MIARVLVCLLMGVLPGSALADISAVGRLENTSTEQTCSGALISPRLVLSAAHCVGALRNAEDAPSGQIVFRPGGISGLDVVRVIRSVVHPLFPVTPAQNGWKLRFDMALFELDFDLPADIATPLPAGREARLGETLYLVSWRAGDTPRPRQRACEVITGTRGLVTVACPVSGGESGAPLLRKTQAGLELVAVLSSRKIQGQQPVAMGSDVITRLPPLLNAASNDEGS